MKAFPLISIIMPTYNAALFIGQAIESVLGQSYQNWELIIVDDASPDNTESIVQRYSDPRIRYQKVARIGHPAGVRNAGLRMAQGEFIAFLDADDLYFPKTLEKLSNVLLENQRLTAVYGFAFNIDEQGKPLPSAIPLIPRPHAAPGESAYYPAGNYNHSWYNILTDNISCLLSSLMLRREAWEQVGFFNETLSGAEDYEFYVRLFLHDYDGVAVIHDYIYQYRIHLSSLTKAPEHCNRVLESSLKILNWIFNEASVPEDIYRYRSIAYASCYRYLARERLLNHQPALAYQVILRAFKDSNIKIRDLYIRCVPILLRSFLPYDLDQHLVNLRKNLRIYFSRYIANRQGI